MKNLEVYEHSVLKVKVIYIIDRDYHKSIKIEDILFCKAEGNYTQVHLEDSKQITISRSLCEMEKRLCELGIMRCHFSYLVNIKKIETFNRKEKNIRLSGYKIPVSRKRSKDVFRTLVEYGIKETRISNTK